MLPTFISIDYVFYTLADKYKNYTSAFLIFPLFFKK